MTNLAKREHEFNDLFDLRHAFDRFFNRALNHSSSSEESSERLILAVPPIEAWVDQDKKEYHLSIAVLGIDPKEIELNVQGRDLTISGEHQTSNEKKDANYLDQGGPLKIHDATGKLIPAKVFVQETYTPAAAEVKASMLLGITRDIQDMLAVFSAESAAGSITLPLLHGLGASHSIFRNNPTIVGIHGDKS